MSNYEPRLTQSSSEEIMEHSYDRPTGVSIFAVLFMVSGVVLLVMNLASAKLLQNVNEFPMFLKTALLVSLFFLSVLGIATGIGTWKGKRWGWWLALFYFAYTILGALNAMISYPGLAESLGVSRASIPSFYIKNSLKVLLNGLILMYYFRESVTEYFGTESVPKWKALGIVAGIGLVIFIGGSFLKAGSSGTENYTKRADFSSLKVCFFIVICGRRAHLWLKIGLEALARRAVLRQIGKLQQSGNDAVGIAACCVHAGFDDELRMEIRLFEWKTKNTS